LQALEIGVFVSSAALMGLFGVEALAAHQIAITCASFTFMVPMGIGQAATVRVATERGAAAWQAARRAGFVALALGAANFAAFIGYCSRRGQSPGLKRSRNFLF
jgi:MATE family multidrug resistance protein